MIKQNPTKLNSKPLKMKVNSAELSTSATVGVEFLKIFSEFNADDPIYPACPTESTIGQITCSGLMEISFEFRLDKTVGSYLYFNIGDWFGLELDTKYTLLAYIRMSFRLKMNNLYNDKNYHGDIGINYLVEKGNFNKSHEILVTILIIKNDENIKVIAAKHNSWG